MHRTTRITAAILAAIAGHAAAQVQHGAIEVIENDCDNTAASVTLLPLTGDGFWTLISDDGLDSSSKGDYVVDFGTGNDSALGVLITGSYEDERTSSCLLDPYFATTSTARSGSGTGRYWIATHGASSGSEVNFNPAFGYFPIAEDWLGGVAYNSENGGVITELVGSPEIALYNLFNDPGTGSALIDSGTGNFGVRLDGIDIRRDGVLLASGAKNEDNFALIHLSHDGTAVVSTKDNGDNQDGSEQDPVGFVFIPDGTVGVTMGVISGTARTFYGQGDFTVEMVGQPVENGQYELTIAGETPGTGTLLVSPATEFGGNNFDNAVSVIPGSDSWIITSRDIPEMTLQDPGSAQVAFHFAFFKTGVDIVPGTPSKDYADRLGVVHSARFAVTEFNPDNTNGDMRTDRAMGSDALDVGGENKGDNLVAFFDARHAAYTDNSLDTYEGVYLVSSSEFIRDNSGTGGVSGWSTQSFDNGEVRSHNASLAGGEINSNFAAAFFPTEAGFAQDADIQVLTDPTFAVSVPGDAVGDGVLIANNWDNNNRVVAVEPSGSYYVVSCWEASGGAQSTDWDFGYVYLPYSTPGLVAGHVGAQGDKISGVGSFTTSQATDQTFGFPVTRITIPGVNATTDGILLVTDTAGGFSSAWEARSDGSFEVASFELATETPGRSSFMFAYIPYEGLTAGEDCVADFNGDDSVDTRDVLAFLNAWAGGDSSADIDGNGVIDTRDVLAFLNLWTAGC